MRDRALHSLLEAFTAEAAGRLNAATVDGEEIPFELVEADGRRGGVPLYCYRPLTETFIDERLGLLAALSTYTPAVRALAVVERVGAYLVKRGERHIPVEPRERAELALRVFLRAVYAERSQLGFAPERFERAYAELEQTLYEGQTLTTIIAPLRGVALDEATDELALGDGLSLIRGEALAGAPPEAVGGGRGYPPVLAMLAVAHDPGARPPLSLARSQFRRLLTALRLFERGDCALGHQAWIRAGEGAWRPFPLGGSGAAGTPLVIAAEQEDELRAFCNLVARRAPSCGEVAWALARFEMGAERPRPLEALSDYLLALRALLEPESPASGRLAGRLAAICVAPDQRAGLAARTARAVALEREVIIGSPPAEPEANELVQELRDNLRALLRDLICGHLQPDLVAVADELLAAEADEVAATAEAASVGG